MATNSYYSQQPDPPLPVANNSNVFSMRPMNNGYTNIPSRPDDDVVNSQLHSSQEPLRPSNKPSNFNRLKQKKYEKFKRYLRVVQLLSKVLTTLFSSVMFGITAYVSITVQTTKGTIREGRGPWPKDTKMWPTIMLLIASAFTLITTIVLLFAYCCCYKRTQTSWKFTVAKYAVQIITWIVVSFLYRYEKGLNGHNNDIWGWSCAKEADAIQAQFHGVVNFDALCKTQVSLR